MGEQVTNIPNKVIGRVVSNKMQKTIIVLVERQVKHPLYQKFLRRSTRYHAHDPENSCKEGDTVAIVQCRPLSKTKNWQLVEIIERARPI